MKTNFLFPNQFKVIGWFMLIPGAFLGITFIMNPSWISVFEAKMFAIAEEKVLNDTVYFSIIKNNLLDELAALLIIIGAIFIAFSKEKHEDEFIARIRLESLMWATYFNYAILILAIIFVYELTFFWVLVFNMTTLLLFFLIRFYWALNQSKYQLKDEK